MKQRKILFLIIACTLFLSSFLYATDISFVGYGISFDEARSSARAEMTAFFNGVMVESSTYSAVSEKPGEGSYEFSLNSRSETRGYLKCVEYINETMVGREYSSTAVIRDSTSNVLIIVNELNTLSSSLEAMEAELHKQLKSERANTLLKMYDTMVEFECYSQILLYMGYDSFSPKSPIHETSRSLYYKYQTLLASSEADSQTIAKYEYLDSFLLQGKWTGMVKDSQFIDYYTLEFEIDNTVTISVESVNSEGVSSFCFGSSGYQYDEAAQILVISIPRLSGSVSHLRYIDWKAMVVINNGDYRSFSINIPVSTNSSRTCKATFYKD